VRENILDAEASDQVRFYVVWLNQRSTDARDEIDEPILADPRVTQYWDEEAVIGTFLADVDLARLGYSGIVYDTYFVFGPDASWEKQPGPVKGAGVPVISYGSELLAEIRAQL
jgi:hypothetical protein